jgi:hypothetical protein
VAYRCIFESVTDENRSKYRTLSFLTVVCVATWVL